MRTLLNFIEIVIAFLSGIVFILYCETLINDRKILKESTTTQKIFFHMKGVLSLLCLLYIISIFIR